jgi:hypothetical protein
MTENPQSSRELSRAQALDLAASLGEPLKAIANLRFRMEELGWSVNDVLYQKTVADHVALGELRMLSAAYGYCDGRLLPKPNSTPQGA